MTDKMPDEIWVIEPWREMRSGVSRRPTDDHTVKYTRATTGNNDQCAKNAHCSDKTDAGEALKALRVLSQLAMCAPAHDLDRLIDTIDKAIKPIKAALTDQQAQIERAGKFVNKLEDELDEKQAQVENWKDAARRQMERQPIHIIDPRQSETIAELVAALENIASHQNTIAGDLVVMSPTYKIATNAIQRAKEAE